MGSPADGAGLRLEVLDDLERVRRGRICEHSGAALELDVFENDALFGSPQDVVAGLGVDEHDAAVGRALGPAPIRNDVFVEVDRTVGVRVGRVERDECPCLAMCVRQVERAAEERDGAGELVLFLGNRAAGANSIDQSSKSGFRPSVRAFIDSSKFRVVIRTSI